MNTDADPKIQYPPKINLESLTEEDVFPVSLFELINQLIKGPDLSIQGNCYAGINWQDPRPMPEFSAIKALLIEMQSISPVDWDGLTSALGEVVGFGSQTTNNNAFALLNSVLIGYRNPQLLYTALTGMQKGMPPNLTFYDETIEFVNKALEEYGFDIRI